MRRRRCLQLAGTVGISSVAGCLSRLVDDSPENVTLPPQEDQMAESEDLAYPAYGQRLPDFEVPDPINELSIRTGELERTSIVTAFFAFCPAECATLLRRLTAVQQNVISDGSNADTAFLPITFDPERDDAVALQEHGRMVGVDFEAGNWHYLRPPDEAAARRIVEGELGIGFERVGGTESRVEGYDFVHSIVTLLVNPDGVVERAYRGETPDVERISDDMIAVTESDTE